MSKKQTGQSIAENRATEGNIVPELGLLQLLVQLRDGHTETVTQYTAQHTGLLVFAPDSLELESGVLLDDLLHCLDVGLVELGDGAVLANAHVLDELRVVKGQRGENLERGGSHTTLVGGGVLEQDAAGLLEAQLGVLGDEQVGAFDDVRNDALVVLDELADGGQVDGLGAATAGHEDVELLLRSAGGRCYGRSCRCERPRRWGA